MTEEFFNKLHENTDIESISDSSDSENVLKSKNNYDENNKILMNKTEAKTLININIIKGIFAEDKNIFTKMETYCVIEIGNKIRLRTNISKSGGTKPVWN